MKDPKVFIALDFSSMTECATLMDELDEFPDIGFKINQDLIVKRGLSTIEFLRSHTEKPIFADLKMWNGKRTMLSTLKALEECGVEYTNIYALAGREALKYLMEEVHEIKILGLTVLTHYDSEYCRNNFGLNLHGAIHEFMLNIQSANLYGGILPPTQVERIRRYQQFENIKLVCPGVRPKWYGDNRHKQHMTPKEAVEAGADMLVMGSPITKSKDRRKALKRVLKEIGERL